MNEKDIHKRFSDEELAVFYDDYKSHKIEETQLSNRLLDCQDDLKHAMESLANSVNSNKESIEKLSKETKIWSKDTKSLLDTWHDAQGTVRIVAIVGKFSQWLAGFGFVGWIVSEYVTKVK